MYKYLTFILIPSLFFVASCGLVDENLDNSETTESSQEIEESVSSNNVEMNELEDKPVIDEEYHSEEEDHEQDMEEEMRLEKEEEMRLEKEEEMRLEMEEEMRLEKEEEMRLEMEEEMR